MAIVQIFPEHIFDEFEVRISDPLYHPADPIETLQARLTATWLLNYPDPQLVRRAEALIQRTSRFKEADLARLRQFSSQVKTWDELRLLSTYTNTLGTFLEYQLSFSLDYGQKKLHFHAQYETEDNRCCFISQTTPLIRVVGDSILHRPGALFPKNPNSEEEQALIKQIEYAKSILIQTSGAGIAANQCVGIEHPYRFIITGIFNEIPEHVAGVARRYPNAKFPQATIMVNPEITSVSQESQRFNHACLSVPCGNRCAVMSPMEISVTYQDPFENMQTKQVRCAGMDAVVLWHELTHILEGKTYM
ncbi:MAG: peptide deformylase, partial [Minisyncoccia bacterium]